MIDAKELGDRYIAGLFADPQHVDEYPVPPDAFVAPSQRNALMAIRSLLSRGEEVNIVSVRVELGRLGARVDDSWLIEITGMLDVDSRATALRLRELYAARRLAAECETARDAARSGNVSEARSVLQAALDGHTDDDEDSLSMREVMARTVEAWEGVDRGEFIGFPLGIHGVADRVVSVLPDKGDCVIVAARPGVGKSTLVDRCLLDLGRRGISCGKVSVEDGDIDFGAKAIGVLGGVATTPFWTRQGSERDWAGANAGAEAGYKLPVRFKQVRGNDLDGVISAMTKMGRRHGCRVIAVDYIQRIGGVEGHDPRERLDKVLAGLIRTARMLPCALLLVSQIKRLGDNPFREPTVEDLKESGSLEEVAQGIVLLWKTTDDRNSDDFGLIKGKVAKVKRGDFGQKFEYRRHPRSGALMDVEYQAEEDFGG